MNECSPPPLSASLFEVVQIDVLENTFDTLNPIGANLQRAAQESLTWTLLESAVIQNMVENGIPQPAGRRRRALSGEEDQDWALARAPLTGFKRQKCRSATRSAEFLSQSHTDMLIYKMQIRLSMKKSEMKTLILSRYPLVFSSINQSAWAGPGFPQVLYDSFQPNAPRTVRLQS